jgi:hypothetical protein
MSSRDAALVSLLLLSGCGGAGPPVTQLIASMVLENETQFDLRELRVHRTADYSQASNLLKTVMPVNASVVFYGDGPYYVTVLREKYHLGPIEAFTTATPVTMDRGAAYRLVILDDSFRVETATREDPNTTKLPIVGDPPPDKGMHTTTSTNTMTSTTSTISH